MSRQGLAVVLALVIGGVLAFAAYLYWNHERAHPSTDDARLTANHVWISPRVDGQVTEVHVIDNQWVEAGTALVRLDARPFKVALERAVSNERLAQQQIQVQKADVEAAQARLRELAADLDKAKAERDRVLQLVQRGDEPKLRGIELTEQYLAAQAQLDDAKAGLVVARQTLGPPDVQQARRERAAAAAALARLNLDWTVIEAPAAGWVTRVTLRPGDVVQRADRLFVLVEDGDWWVQANYKETKLGGIGPGMPAEVRIDSWPGRTFTGRVESIGPASAASFSLLPAQNTTGNWVKVTQRIPVRIRLEPMGRDTPYRLGASARVTIDIDAPVAGAGQPREGAAGG
jgi:membrane fusion protein (multidrug efflux system)